MDEKVNLTRLYYDGISSGYSQLYHDEQIKKINLVKKYFPNSGLVLDLGCADGVLNPFLSKNIKLISFDLSFNLLILNSNKLRVLGSAQDLPFKTNIFDLVFAFTVIQDVPNPDLVLKNIFNSLKFEGVLILSFLKISKKSELIISKINELFKIIDLIEEEKDNIYILKKIKN